MSLKVSRCPSNNVAQGLPLSNTMSACSSVLQVCLLPMRVCVSMQPLRPYARLTRRYPVTQGPAWPSLQSPKGQPAPRWPAAPQLHAQHNRGDHLLPAPQRRGGRRHQHRPAGGVLPAASLKVCPCPPRGLLASLVTKGTCTQGPAGLAGH